jgi:hypothetical protein
VRLVVQSAAHVRRRRVLQKIFPDRVPIEPGDDAQPPGDGDGDAGLGFQFAAEGLDAGAGTGCGGYRVPPDG